MKKQGIVSGVFALAIFHFFSLLFFSICVTATLSASNAGPVVQLSYGSFQENATADLEEFRLLPHRMHPIQYLLVPTLKIMSLS